MRPKPIVRPVLSDEEAELQAKADGKSAQEIAALMAEREANQRALQTAYDDKPPTRPYVPPQE